jgi:hypothetical protein
VLPFVIPFLIPQNSESFNITLEEFGNQLRTCSVKSHNSTFLGVNWKILRLNKVLLQFTEKGGDV